MASLAHPVAQLSFRVNPVTKPLQQPHRPRHTRTRIFHTIYDNAGNLIQKTDPRGITTTFSYDALNRLKQKSYSDSTPLTSYFYDEAGVPFGKGRLTKVVSGSLSSPFSTTQYLAFDALGGVLSHQQTTDGQSYSTSYNYNLAGELLEETYPSGRVVKNVLNNDGRLSMVQSRRLNTGFWNYARSFNYLASGAASSLRLGNGHWESMQFNTRFQPTQIAIGNIPGATDLLKLDYSYGTIQNNGNVLSQTITVPAVGNNNGFSAIQTYTYDSLNRLKDATETISGNQNWRQAFIYDRYGNRTLDETNTTTLTKACGTAPNFTVCPANRKIENPSISTGSNRIVLDQDGDSIDDYSFDSNGNVTRDAQGRAFTYDGRDKQIEVRNSSNEVIGQYFYDGDRKRVKKISNNETVIFVYDAFGKLIAEYANQAPQNPQLAYLTADNLGTSRIATDANGAIIARHDYHPFGTEIASSQRTQNLGYTSDSVRQTFTGYEKDSETDLNFAQARYYSMRIGRFYSVDPSGGSARKWNPQSINRYAYVLNNPLNLRDPSGLDPQSCGHVGEPPCKRDDGKPGYIVDVKGSDDGVDGSSGKSGKGKPWYKRAWNWVKNQISPGARAQGVEPEEEPAEREELTKEEREELLRSEGFEPKEEPIPPRLTGAEKTELFRRMNPGARPEDIPCFEDDPEPTPSMGNPNDPGPIGPPSPPEENSNNELTPTTSASSFGPVRGRPARRNLETGEIWVFDRLHRDHYEVYKNMRNYERGRRDRAVWVNGKLKEIF